MVIYFLFIYLEEKEKENSKPGVVNRMPHSLSVHNIFLWAIMPFVYSLWVAKSTQVPVFDISITALHTPYALLFLIILIGLLYDFIIYLLIGIMMRMPGRGTKHGRERNNIDLES